MNTEAESETTESRRHGHQAVDHRRSENDSRGGYTGSGQRDASGSIGEPTSTHAATGSEATPASRSNAGLLDSDKRHDYRERWDELQARFVDDPRGSTEEADRLLEEAFEDLVSRWRDRHRELKSGWSGSEASTEELRTSLRRYRDTFERLLAM